MATEDKQKTYILEPLSPSSGKTRRITVPASWKVTFGPLIPGGGKQGTLALRFYEGKDQQRAIFTDVGSFRDADIPLEERVTRTQQKRHTKQTPEGAKDFVVEARMTTWRNADDPDDVMPSDEFTAIPDFSDTEL